MAKERRINLIKGGIVMKNTQKNVVQKQKSIPRFLERISDSAKKSDAAAWGKGMGGGYPWRKK